MALDKFPLLNNVYSHDCNNLQEGGEAYFFYKNNLSRGIYSVRNNTPDIQTISKFEINGSLLTNYTYDVSKWVIDTWDISNLNVISIRKLVIGDNVRDTFNRPSVYKCNASSVVYQKFSNFLVGNAIDNNEKNKEANRSQVFNQMKLTRQEYQNVITRFCGSRPLLSQSLMEAFANHLRVDPRSVSLARMFLESRSYSDSNEPYGEYSVCMGVFYIPSGTKKCEMNFSESGQIDGFCSPIDRSYTGKLLSNYAKQYWILYPPYVLRPSKDKELQYDPVTKTYRPSDLN